MNDGVSELSDEHLVGRCMAGDEWAWTALVRRHARLIFSLARRSVRRVDEAEDLTQDIIWKVSRMLDRYDRNLPFKPWMLQIARNHLIDHHRSFRREKSSTIELDALPVEPASRPATQQSQLLAKERTAAIRKGLDTVPEVLREAVMLRDVDGLEYDEIAAALDIPLGTVKSRINRGRLVLARALSGLEGKLA